MKIDVVRRILLTPIERERFARIGTCFYCRQVGHVIKSCPNRHNIPIRQVIHVNRVEEDIKEHLSKNEESQ